MAASIYDFFSLTIFLNSWSDVMQTLHEINTILIRRFIIIVILKKKKDGAKYKQKHKSTYYALQLK